MHTSSEEYCYALLCFKARILSSQLLEEARHHYVPWVVTSS